MISPMNPARRSLTFSFSLTLAVLGSISALWQNVNAAPRVASTIQLSQNSGLDQPIPMAAASDGTLYVGGYYSGTVVKINPSTKKVTAQAGGMRYPVDIRLHDNKVYVSALDSGNQAQIMVFDLNLNFVKSIASQNGWIHSFVIDSDAAKLYYGTWGKLHVIDLSNDSQRQIADLGNWFYAVSSMNLDKVRNKLYLTIYNSDQATAEMAHFDLTGETIGTRLDIGKNPVGVDSRYDSDRDGDKLFITQMYSSSITVVDVSNDSVQHLPNISWPQRLIADRGRHKLYIVDNYTDKLHILNTQTLALEHSMTPGDDPSGVAFDASRNRIYTSNVWSQDVSIVDYNSFALIERISFAPATPLDGEIDGGAFYLSNGPNGGIYKIDAGDHRILEKINFYDYMLMSGLFNFPAGFLNLYGGEMELPAAGGDRRAYALDEFNQGIAEYNLTTHRYIGNIRPDGMPTSLTVYNGKLYFPYVSNSNLYLGIHDGSAITSKLIGPSDRAQGIKINPATGKCYIADYSNHKVVVYDLSTFAVLQRIDVGEYPANIVIDSAVNLIYVTNYGGNSVTVIDGVTHSVKATVPVGNGPWGIGINAAKKRIYVVNTDDNSLSVIDARNVHSVIATLPVAGGAKFCTVDTARHQIFVPGQTAGAVTVIEDVADATPPVFDCPAAILKENVESDSVVVNFNTPAVTDDMDPSPTITLSPASGSSFNVGVTTVTVIAQDAGGNIARCAFTVTVKKKICPRNVGDLAANPIAGRKIEVSWSPSITPDIKEYRIYMGEDNVDFNSPAAIVLPTVTSWTAQNLRSGGTYKFVVRAMHKGGCEETNTNIVAATAFETPPCLSASIKSPKNGQKVSGERLTVTADIRCDNSTSVKSVRFEYRRAWENSWKKIPAANSEHPNPDLQAPYFVHWNVEDLANGEYLVRSVAIDAQGNEDDCPSYVTIVVDHADPDCEERRDDNGKVEKIEKIENQKKNTVIISDGKMSCPAEVQIPAGCLSNDETKVTVKLNPDTPRSDRLKAAGSSIEIELHSGQSNLAGEATLTLPYVDEDDDGIVDGKNIRAQDLAVFYYNPAHRKWDKMSGSVNRKNKTVIARTSHFSLFALFDAQSAADATFTLGEAFAYPNPARGGRNPILHFETGVADEVTMRIYDASGELKHTISMGNSPTVVNDKYAYEAVWDVSNIASGVYVVTATAKKDGQTLRKNFKLAVVK